MPNWIRNLFTPLEWTIFALIVFLMIVFAVDFTSTVIACGSEGFGPAATQNC